MIDYVYNDKIWFLKNSNCYYKKIVIVDEISNNEINLKATVIIKKKF